MFNFKVRHVLKHKHTAANSFLKQLKTKFNNYNKLHNININKFINVKLSSLKISLILVLKQERTYKLNANSLNKKYFKKHVNIAKFLTTLKKLYFINKRKF